MRSRGFAEGLWVRMRELVSWACGHRCGGGRELLGKLLQFIHVYATDEDDCAFMDRSDWSGLKDYLVYRSALGVKADGIVSRDADGFAMSSIKVYDYDALFAYMKEVLDLDYELIEI